MPLSPEDIKRLLAVKPARKSGGGKKSIDHSERTIRVWFLLAHKLFDEVTQSTAKCDNPDCIDPRPENTRSAVVAEINGKKLCRFCFLDGWHNQQTNPEQLALSSDNASAASNVESGNNG